MLQCYAPMLHLLVEKVLSIRGKFIDIELLLIFNLFDNCFSDYNKNDAIRKLQLFHLKFISHADV